MIQRIQSIYLLLAALFMGAAFYFPLADAIGALDSIVLYSYKVESLVPDSIPNLPVYFMYPLFGLSSLILVFCITTIFLFRTRMRQMMFIRFSVILVVVLIALFFFYYSPELEKASGGIAMYKIPGAYLPIGTLVFLILASRAIMADEKLIRSADRLR